MDIVDIIELRLREGNNQIQELERLLDVKDDEIERLNLVIHDMRKEIGHLRAREC